MGPMPVEYLFARHVCGPVEVVGGERLQHEQFFGEAVGKLQPPFQELGGFQVEHSQVCLTARTD